MEHLTDDAIIDYALEPQTTASAVAEHLRSCEQCAREVAAYRHLIDVGRESAEDHGPTQPPPPELAPSCAEGGVLGVLPGIIGSLQASEALKLALGIGETLSGRLLLFDALSTEFTEVTLKRDPNCPVCSDAAVAARKAGVPFQVDGVNVEAPFLMTGSFGGAA